MIIVLIFCIRFGFWVETIICSVKNLVCCILLETVLTVVQNMWLPSPDVLLTNIVLSCRRVIVILGFWKIYC